jgi:probable selenium-dependent hydroxylase accessory protein YqeC
MLEGGGVVSIVGAGGKTTLLFRLAAELSQEGEAVLTTTTTKMRMPAREQCPTVIVSSLPDEALSRARERLKETPHVFAASGHASDQGKLAGFSPEAVEAFWRSGLFQWILVEADGAAQRPLKAPASHEPVIPDGSGWVIGVVGLDAVGKPLHEAWVFRPEQYSEITGLPMGHAVTEASVAKILVGQEGVMKGSPPVAVRLAFLNKVNCEGGMDAGRRIVAHLLGMRGHGLSRVVLGSALLDPPVAEWYDLNGVRRGS